MSRKKSKSVVAGRKILDSRRYFAKNVLINTGKCVNQYRLLSNNGLPKYGASVARLSTSWKILK